MAVEPTRESDKLRDIMGSRLVISLSIDLHMHKMCMYRTAVRDKRFFTYQRIHYLRYYLNLLFNVRGHGIKKRG